MAGGLLKVRRQLLKRGGKVGGHRQPQLVSSDRQGQDDEQEQQRPDDLWRYFEAEHKPPFPMGSTKAGLILTTRSRSSHDKLFLKPSPTTSLHVRVIPL